MSINNIQKYLIKPNKTRKFVTHLNKTGVLLPVILLESTVTAGRTYQAYKRGGAAEARERICEESLGAVFWLWGVKAFNSIGDKIGKKFLNVKNPDFSLAKDAVRQPFENMLRDKNAEKLRKFLIGFKFTKIVFSVIAAASILGFVVPKFNQKVTRALLNKKEEKATQQDQIKKDNTDKLTKTQTPTIQKGMSLENFINKTTPNSKKPAFGGMSIETFAKITNNLENNDICKLLATDVGVLTGRTYNARNKDERIEILFRDGASVYFYLRCKDDVINFIKKHDGYNGKLSSLNPMAAMHTHNLLVKEMGKTANTENISLPISKVKELLLGTNPKQVETDLAKFDFKKGDVIALQDVKKVLGQNEKLIAKAQKMSELQPQRLLSDLGYDTVGGLLTKQQVKDVLSDSSISSPELLKDVIKDAFNGDATNPYRFIPTSKIEALRTNIEDYAQVIIKYAEKNNLSEITPETLLKINKMNFRRNALQIGSGIGIAALFLSTIIPKIQYLITKLRTGSDSFPGIKDNK